MTAGHILREGWCQGVYARNTSGQETRLDRPGAVKWSLRGAIMRAYPHPGVRAPIIEAAWATIQANDPTFVSPHAADAPARWHLDAWNDVKDRTRPEILAVLDAVERERAHG
jgi:hypothetical protein